MGFFDIPAPLLSWVDTSFLGFLPALVRLCLWGIAAAALSMFLYVKISPQQRLEQTKEDAGRALKALAVYDGPFEGLWPLLKKSLGLSMKQIGLALGPALAASLPVLFVLVWLSNAYGYAAPLPGARVELSVSPLGQSAMAAQNFVTWPVPGETLPLHDAQGALLATLPLPAPIPVIHKRMWWNVLIGNPSGYLPDRTTVKEVVFNLTPRAYLSFGPVWMRGWEFVFFVILIVTSLMIKVIYRIH